MSVIELELRLGKCKYSGDQVRFNCPFCIRRKGSPDKQHHLYLSTDKRVWICFRCDERGPLTKLYRFLGMPVDAEEDVSWTAVDQFMVQIEKLRLTAVVPPQTIDFPCEVRIPIPGSEAYSYLAARGVTDAQIRFYKMRWGYFKGADRIFVPCFALDGRMEYWVARAYDNYAGRDTAKYVNPDIGNKGVFNLDRQSGREPLIIVEGVFDAIAAGYNAVALFGKTLSRRQFNLLLSRSFPEYVIALDGDARSETLKMVELLHHAGRRVSMVELPSDLDPATDREFLNRIKERSQVDFLHLVGSRLRN